MVLVPAFLYIVFGLLHQRFSTLLVALQEHAVACFVVGILLQWYCGLFRVEDQRILALISQGWIVAIQGPVAGLDRQFLLFQSLAHVNTMRDAMTVGDDERGAIVCLGFQERVKRLLV